MTLSIEALKTALPLLGASDQKFATSLLAAAPRGLSDKQAYWVQKLIERATAPKADKRPSQSIGSLSGIMALFAKAAAHLKRPSILLLFNDSLFRLKPAGGKTRYPGAIHITGERDGDGEQPYVGRITPEGEFIYSGRGCGNMDFVKFAALLARLAADPAKVAAEHGKLTGKCCFCNRGLDDERSTSTGYGPICADHYGLPWGERAEEFAGKAY